MLSLSHVLPLLRAARTLAALGIALLAPSLPAKPIAAQGSPGHRVSHEQENTSELSELDAAPRHEPRFDTFFSPLPANVPSVSFEATGTREFGDWVRLAAPMNHIDSIDVTLSSWATRSDYPGGSPLGFTHPITLRLYRVDRSHGTPRAGDPIATFTQSFLVPWRPEPDPTSNSPLRPWRGADGNFYPGVAFTVTFDLGDLVLPLPDEIIFGISFNTARQGPEAIGRPGPYDKLHLGLSASPPRAGADPDPDAVFWRTAHAWNYADAGAAGADVFRRDAGWGAFKPAVRFNNSAYGALAAAAARLGGLPARDAASAAALERAYTLLSWALERRLWNGNSALEPGAGRLVFDLLAESVAASTAGADTLLRVGQDVAERALGDALILGADPVRVAHAEAALETAHRHIREGRLAEAIDHLGEAWNQAGLAVR